MKASGLTGSQRIGRSAEQSDYSGVSAYLSPTVSIPMYSRNANVRDSRSSTAAMTARGNYETEIGTMVMPSYE